MHSGEVINSLSTFPATVATSNYPVSQATAITGGIISPVGSFSLANSKPIDKNEQLCKIPNQIHSPNLPVFLNTNSFQNNTNLKHEVLDNGS